MHTYTQFFNLAFSPLLKTNKELLFLTLIKDYNKAAFIPFIDNYIGAIIDF
jgi:hypothetical protein